MVTLIIADLHHHYEWVETTLANTPHDEVVFLGDYFDSYHDTPQQAAATAQWLAFSITQPKRIHLLGNHDGWYLTKEAQEFLYCPGNIYSKKLAIQPHLPNHFSSFRMCYITQGWLLSHAGASRYHCPNMSMVQIEEYGKHAMETVMRGHQHPLFAIGKVRGGTLPVGGMIWQDWYEFNPIPGVNQIVGHTYGKKIRQKTGVDSKNFCLDCAGHWSGRLVDGSFTPVRNKGCGWDPRK